MTDVVIRGRVIARDTGAPVPRAIVHAFGNDVRAWTEADEHGAFILQAPPAVAMYVLARGHGYGSNELVRVPGDADVDVVLDPAFAIRGRAVLDTDPDRGVAGAEVTVRPDVGGHPATAVTDEDGRFEVNGVVPGRYQLSALQTEMVARPAALRELVDRDLVDVRIEMKRGATLAGRVEPPAIAQIGITPIRQAGPVGRADSLARYESLLRARTRSDTTGRFVVTGIPAGDFELRAMAEDGRSGSVRITVGADDQADLVVTLSPRCSVAGHVTDPEGRPLAGYRVGTHRFDAPLAKRFVADNIERSTKSAEDGSFSLVGLEAGRYSISVQSPSPGTVGGSSMDVDLADGDRSGVTIVVPIDPAVLRGRVLGIDGASVLGLSITASLEPREPGGHPEHVVLTETDREGSFVVEHVPAGTYAVVVTDLGRPLGEFRGLETDVPNTLQLAPLGSVTIEVSRDGVPARGVTLVCVRGFESQDARDVHGAHTFTDLPPGADHGFEASGPAGIATATVTVTAGHSVLRLELEDPATATGVLADVLTGAPLPRMVVKAPGLAPGTTRGTSAETDETGRFVVEGLPPGSGTLWIGTRRHSGYRLETYRYQATAGERVDLGTVAILAPRTTEAGTFGLSLEASDGHLRVIRIAKDSPADRAAIVPGEMIVSVAGHPVSALGLERARQLLASDSVPIGQTLTVALDARSIELTSVAW